MTTSKSTTGKNSLANPFVFGSTGTLGIAIKKQFQERGIRTNQNLEEQFKENFRVLGSQIFNFEEFRNSNFTSVIYVAQSRFYKDYPVGLTDLAYINVFLPIRFAEVCEELKIPFIYTSTGSVYQKTDKYIYEESPLVSSNDLNPYVLSKLFTDQYLSALSKAHRITVFRPFYIYGSGAKIPALFPSLVNSIVTGKAIMLTGENGLEINPIHSRDAARAILHTLETENYGIFNLGGREEINLREVCEIIESVLGKKASLSISDTQAKMVSNQSKLLSTNFVYESTFREDFREYVSEFTKS